MREFRHDDAGKPSITRKLGSNRTGIELGVYVLHR